MKFSSFAFLSGSGRFRKPVSILTIIWGIIQCIQKCNVFVYLLSVYSEQFGQNLNIWNSEFLFKADVPRKIWCEWEIGLTRQKLCHFCLAAVGVRLNFFCVLSLNSSKTSLNRSHCFYSHNGFGLVSVSNSLYPSIRTMTSPNRCLLIDLQQKKRPQSCSVNELWKSLPDIHVVDSGFFRICQKNKDL